MGWPKPGIDRRLVCSSSCREDNLFLIFFKAFGIKHVARELADKAGVPIVPGTKGLVKSEEDALQESEKLGYPVMLKATAGGGGMGLVVCHEPGEVKEGFRMVQSRGIVSAPGSKHLV